MVTTDVELELRQHLMESGKQISNPPASVDELLHILDQSYKLLSTVEQSPDNLMQEALKQLMKALVDYNLLKHSNTDVKASVAVCICEITRITAPEAPYADEEMKGIFQLIVSSFEYLYDESSRSYGKRVAILESVFKVRSCVIMLDLECHDLIVKMFEHFLKSVRDHHLDKVFTLMSDIMALVIEESEEISVGILKPLLASIKNEGVLPVARKLAEEVIKKSADKLRPYVKKTLNILTDSLDIYSQVLTALSGEKINVAKHNDETVLVHQNVDETKPAPFSDDAVMSNGTMVTNNEEGSDDKESKKSEEAVDHPDSNLTSSVTEKSTKIETKPESYSKQEEIKSTEPTDSSHVDAEKIPEKASKLISDSEMKSPKHGRKKRLKATSGSDTELLKKSTKKVETVDSESKPVKRSGKKKVGGGGSDAETVQMPTKEVDTVDSESKLVKSGKDSVAMKGNKLSGKKTVGGSKQSGSKKVEEPKSESDDDGMDVPINSVLKKTLTTSAKRKRSVGKPKVKDGLKYDDNLVGKKIKVWWPKDKMYYEGVIKSFDAAKKKHEVLYLDGDSEILNLRNQKWEIVDDEGTETALQSTDNTETKGDGNEGEEAKVDNTPKSVNLKEVEKSMENEEAKNSQEPKRIVYKSRGRNKNKIKTPKTEEKADVSEPKSVCETVDEEMKDADVAEEPESVKEKSNVGSVIGNKRKKT